MKCERGKDTCVSGYNALLKNTTSPNNLRQTEQKKHLYTFRWTKWFKV